MKQNEREYREALDGLEFSNEAKERMMNNLMKREEQVPVKRRSLRPLRVGLIAAALCAALLGTAAAATVMARQTRVTYIDGDQFRQEYNEYMDEHGHNPPNYDDSQYSGMDFNGADAEYRETWWQGPGGELVEDVAGTPEEGWEAKRVFKYRQSGWSYPSLHNKECTETRYRSSFVSDFDGLWDCWDVSWLEEHYTTNPYGVWSRTLAGGDGLAFMAVGGEFCGEEDTRFNMSYSWDSDYIYGDEVRNSASRQYSELYTTPDGVELAIDMDTSATGKSVFWVTLRGGHNSFSMFGTQLALNDLHDILDSLNLSKLLEYSPAV